MGGIYWLASYPKSGNTWFRSFLSNLLNDGERPADINELDAGAIASSRDWIDEVLGFDSAELDHDEVERLRPAVYRWSLRDDAIGYHKIHDAYTLTVDGEPLVSREATLGAIYLLRNPLDVVPSYASHSACSLDEAIAQLGEPDYAWCRSRKRFAVAASSETADLVGTRPELGRCARPQLSRRALRGHAGAAGSTPSRAPHVSCNWPTTANASKKPYASATSRCCRNRRNARGSRKRAPGSARFFRQGRSGGWRDKLSGAQVDRIVADHGQVMRRFGYLDPTGEPV